MFANFIHIIGSFLNTEDLNSFSHVSTNHLLFYKDALENRKPEELLEAVFNANSSRVKLILSKCVKNEKECIVLKKMQMREGYYTGILKLEKTIMRSWQSISPLEAAAWTGDNFLVKELLKFVPNEFKREAAVQLHNILHRSSKEENGVYLAPFRELLSAYEAFFKFFADCYGMLIYQDEVKFQKVWIQGVGTRQRFLPTYGVQEFLDRERSQKSLAHLDTEPDRVCRLLGPDSSWINSFRLSKTAHSKGEGTFAWDGELNFKTLAERARLDYAMIKRLCEVRTSELQNIIKELAPEIIQQNTSKKEHKKPCGRKGCVIS